MQRHIKNVTAKLEQQQQQQHQQQHQQQQQQQQQHQQQQHHKEIQPQMCPIAIGEHIVPVIHQVMQ